MQNTFQTKSLVFCPVCPLVFDLFVHFAKIKILLYLKVCFILLQIGVVPGDPHPGDPRGKYFSGSPFPGEFFHGDPGEN